VRLKLGLGLATALTLVGGTVAFATTVPDVLYE
jgi:hypothetical protein